MQHQSIPAPFATLFDHIVESILSGAEASAMATLAGVCDAAALQPDLLDQVRRDLACHPLAGILGEDPRFAAASQLGGTTLLTALCADPVSAPVSTAARLTAQSALHRLIQSLRTRRERAGRMVELAWQRGDHICLLGGGPLLAAPALIGRDLSNITVVEPCEQSALRVLDLFGGGIDLRRADPARFLQSRRRLRTRRYDYICAAELTDSIAPTDLPGWIAAIAGRLQPGGAASLAPLIPAHPGIGWRAVYLQWQPHCHGDADMARAAQACALTHHSFLDQSGSVAWTELIPHGAQPDAPEISILKEDRA